MQSNMEGHTALVNDRSHSSAPLTTVGGYDAEPALIRFRALGSLRLSARVTTMLRTLWSLMTRRQKRSLGWLRTAKPNSLAIAAQDAIQELKNKEEVFADAETTATL